MHPIIKDALVYANCISMMSIGFTLVYLISRVPNFAQSTFAVVGIYCTFFMARIFNLNPYFALPLGFVVGGLLALFVYLGVISNLSKHDAGPILLTISLLAIQQIFLAGINIFKDYVQIISQKYTLGFLFKMYDFSIGGLPGVLVVSSILVITIVITMHLLLTKTQFGIAMRAIVENAALASVLGINVNLISTISWFITGGLAGLAGTILPFWFQCGPWTGGMLSTSIFASSIVGGLSSIYGAILGAYFISLIEVLGSYFLMKIVGTWIGAYRMLLPLIFMSIVLLFEPGGFVSVITKLRIKYRKYKRGRS